MAENQATSDGKKMDMLTEGIVGILRPAVEEIDLNVLNTRESQLQLREHIDKLMEDLQLLSRIQKPPIDLDPYVKKLLNCRRKVTLVNSILQNTQERLNKLQQNISKEISRKKVLAETPTTE